MQHRVLSSCFKLAVLAGALKPEENPMPYVPRPDGEDPEPRPLDIEAEQHRKVFGRIESWLNDERGESRYMRLYYLLPLGTGMRPGEGLAIRWCDITKEQEDGTDRVRSVLDVSATVKTKPEVGPYRKLGRKSGNPYRVVLPDWLAGELDAEKATANPASEDLPVIQGPRSPGEFVSVSNARMALWAMRAAGKLDFRWSDLRDTAATHVAEF